MSKHLKKTINDEYIIDQIRKYNRACRLTYQDTALVAVGVHVGILQKRRTLMPEINMNERKLVLAYLKSFAIQKGLEVNFKPLIALRFENQQESGEID